MRNKVIVVGAGAAGLMAACAAVDAGAEVIVIDQNEKAGKKLFLTGKGRCNYTNACDTCDFFDHVLRNPKFLYHALYSFDATAMTTFLEENGCPTKVERGRRCFPASDHAYDVTNALVRHIRKKGGKLVLNRKVNRILVRSFPEEGTEKEQRKAVGCEWGNGEKEEADAVIIATGGLSYPSTGSTGDGYRFAKELGLSVAPQEPSLVPLIVEETWPKKLEGLTLKNVAVRLEEIPGETSRKQKKNNIIFEDFGEMSFGHDQLEGPIILSCSCHVNFISCPQGYWLHLDLKSALTQEKLEARIEREISLAPKKELKTLLRSLFPQKLAEVVAELYVLQCEEEQSGNDEILQKTKQVNRLNSRDIKNLAALIKDIPLHCTGTGGFEKAIMTRGGVCVNEINPMTMESRSIPGLYWAGEVLDVDAYTGGYNLQIAWSTGHLAGESAAKR